MKKKLFLVWMVCLTGVLFAQTAQTASKSYEALFFVLTDVSTRLNADETYQVLWENSTNGRFFIATVTGQDQNGKNTYGRNAYIINPQGRNEKYPMFNVRDAVTTSSIISSVQECGTIVLGESQLEMRGLQIRITTLTLNNANAIARFERILQSLQ